MKRKSIPQYQLRRWRKYQSHRVDFDSSEFSIDMTEILDELKSIRDPKYSEKVQSLISSLKKYAKNDPISPITVDSYSYKGYDIPHHTHMNIKISMSNCEVWSKDIDETNRFKYQIITKNSDGKPIKVIRVVQISSHNKQLDIRLESRRFSQEKLTERDLWLQEHSHLPKALQDYLMPLHLKYPDMEPISEDLKEKMVKAENFTHRKKPILKELPPLSEQDLKKYGIFGSLIPRINK